MRGGGGEAEGPASAKSLGNARGGGAGFRSSAPSLVMRVVFRLTMKRRGSFFFRDGFSELVFRRGDCFPSRCLLPSHSPSCQIILHFTVLKLNHRTQTTSSEHFVRYVSRL